jgi:hypothetical protein
VSGYRPTIQDTGTVLHLILDTPDVNAQWLYVLLSLFRLQFQLQYVFQQPAELMLYYLQATVYPLYCNLSVVWFAHSNPLTASFSTVIVADLHIELSPEDRRDR